MNLHSSEVLKILHVAYIVAKYEDGVQGTLDQFLLAIEDAFKELMEDFASGN